MSDDWHSAYQSERLAHEATKKRLEELEDAIRDRQDVPIRGYKDPGYYRQGEIDKLFNQAIANSRERQEENRLRKKVAKFIDRNGGEAIGL